ncbi:hypothetical protein Tco_1326067, partial [Tanacetum coccineum]
MISHKLLNEAAFSAAEEKEIKSKSAPIKRLPPWMIKEGMNLTNEKSGVVMQESNTDGTTSFIDDQKDEKNSVGPEFDDKKKLQASSRTNTFEEIDYDYRGPPKSLLKWYGYLSDEYKYKR